MANSSKQKKQLRAQAEKQAANHSGKNKAAAHASGASKHSSAVEVVPRMRVRIIGIGGGGGNIVREIAQRVPKADFLAANTDMQALRDMPRRVKAFSFGRELTGGLGCGMNPELGERAAKAEKDRIRKIFEGQDVCIFVASLGGGTASGSMPLFIQAANEAKCLTIGIFTLPFQFEGEKRKQIARMSLERMKQSLNAHIVVPNENIFTFIDPNTSMKNAFSGVNRYLAEGLEGLVETVSLPGLINIDFADLKAVLEGRGRLAYLQSASAGGAAKVQEVTQQVLFNPLCGYGIEGAERILFNVSADRNLKMQEMVEISNAIFSSNPRAKIIFGISHQPKLKDKIRVTLFTVGCKDGVERDSKRQNSAQQQQEKEPVQKAEPKPKKERAKPVKKKRPVATEQEHSQKEQETKEQETQQDTPQEEQVRSPSALSYSRRNGLDVKKAVDQEMKELEEKEKEWEIPAFLRNRSA